MLKNQEQLQIEIERKSEAVCLMHITGILGLSLISKPIFSDINSNFDLYNIFELLTVSQKLQIPWLYKKCLKELILERFQHLNFNRFELFQLKVEDFKRVIQIHQETVRSNRVKGLSHRRIKQIIQSYCQRWEVTIDIDQLLSLGLKTILEHEQQEEEESIEREQNLQLDKGQEEGCVEYYLSDDQENQNFDMSVERLAGSVGLLEIDFDNLYEDQQTNFVSFTKLTQNWRVEQQISRKSSEEICAED